MARPEAILSSANCGTKKSQNLKRTATYANELQVGHGELRRAIGHKIARHCHGEVLLRLIIRRVGRRELAIEGACIEGGAEFIGWVGAQSIFGTLQQRDHNRNLGDRPGELLFFISADPNTGEFGWILTERSTWTMRC